MAMNANELILANMNELTEEERKELEAMMQEEMEQSQEGVELRPTLVKINKDTLQFYDPFGEMFKTLEGIVIYKQKIRGYWDDPTEKVPACSSMDCVSGIETETGKVKSCATCPNNRWGTSIDQKGNPTKGKACKEMRRLYILRDGDRVPCLLRVPPTSIKNCDIYFSNRINKGIPDIARKTVLRLTEASNGGFNYAVIQFELGDPVTLQEFKAYRKMRNAIKAIAQQTQITADDYEVTEDDDNSLDAWE